MCCKWKQLKITIILHVNFLEISRLFCKQNKTLGREIKVSHFQLGGGEINHQRVMAALGFHLAEERIRHDVSGSDAKKLELHQWCHSNFLPPVNE